MPIPIYIIQKFESKFTKGGPDECWVWERGKFGSGYGQFSAIGECRANRVAYRIYVGPIPDGLCVCHSCDNPACVNPSHLTLGTNKQNSEDMVSKGRQARGDQNGSRLHPEKLRRGNNHPARIHPEYLLRGEYNNKTKLKVCQVVEIRKRHSRGESCASLGREFGVYGSTIQGIVKRTGWRWVP